MKLFQTTGTWLCVPVLLQQKSAAQDHEEDGYQLNQPLAEGVTATVLILVVVVVATAVFSCLLLQEVL